MTVIQPYRLQQPWRCRARGGWAPRPDEPPVWGDSGENWGASRLPALAGRGSEGLGGFCPEEGVRDREMDGRTDGQMDGRTEGWMDRWTDRWRDGWMDGWTEGWIDGRMDGWMDGCTMDACMDGWMDS